MDKCRNSGLDLARVLALVCIMTCLFCSVYGNPLAEAVHDVLAVLGNSLFFVLSGLLLGRKWMADGCTSYGVGFVIRRVKRLYPPFAVFVAIYVSVLFYKGVEIPVWRIVMNMGMLSWFAKLPGAGHLWFVTGMMILYFVFMGASRFGGGLRVRISALWIWLFVVVGGAIALMHFYGFRQTYYIVFVLGSLIAFLYGDNLLQRNNKILWWGVAVLGIVALVLLRNVETLNSIVAVAIALVVVAGCMSVDIGRCVCMVSWFAGISYEMYLVHCVFQNATLFNFKALCGNVYIFALNYVVCSVMTAVLLKNVVKLFNHKSSPKQLATDN